MTFTHSPSHAGRRLVSAVGFLFAALVAVACSGIQEADGPTEGGVVGSEADLGGSESDAEVSVEEGLIDRSGPFTITVFHEQSSDVVEVDLVAPTNAAEVQVAFEPNFSGALWRTVENQDVRTFSTGVQEFFVRYRASDGSAIGDVEARALSVLPALTPLIGDVADARHVRVTRVGGDVLQIDLIVGEVVSQETGQAWLAGPDLPVEQWAAENMGVRIDAVPLEVVEVSRQSWPVGRIDELFAMRHRLHIRIAQAVDGSNAEVDLPGFGEPVSGSVGESSFSPAIRLGELGWGVSDQKLSFVSVWTLFAEPIEAVGGAVARVVDAETGEEVLAATGQPFEQPVEEGELWRGDLTGGPTTVFDLSELQTPGLYRVCVDNLGCSTLFTVSEDGPWEGLTSTVARALFHQRSGLEMQQPFTAFARPRSYHPDDGLTVEASAQTLVEDANGLGDGPFFDELVAARTGEVVEDVWGGHFDAGDWDRRISHLWMARRLTDLVEYFPDTTGAIELNIPESGDDVPDLLDEARWTLDVFTRLQEADGGVRGGIEAAGHPVDGDTSWTESLDVFAFAPDAWSTSIYAGAAADMAFVLDRYDAAAATQYLDSAVRAMEWVEDNLDTVPADERDLDVQRATAAVSLYRATGDERWHDLFLELSVLPGEIDVNPCILGSSCEGTWRYATLPAGLGRQDVREQAIASIVNAAEGSLFSGRTTAFGWAPEAPNPPLIWSSGPSTAHSVGIMRAFLLTGDQRYRDQAVRNASFVVGGNPAGTSYITGVGTENPRQPLLVDQRTVGLPIWPGTPVYGVFTGWRLPDWYLNFFLRDAGTTPDPAGWPTLHSFSDQGSFAGQSEFTVHQSHGESIWTFGSLHGTANFSPDDAFTAE